MTLKYKKAYFRSIFEVDIKDEEMEAPKDDEVVVRVKACAICASDRGLWESTGNPGHEVAGVVTDVGEGVTQVKPKDRVTVYWRLGCGSCNYCRRGYELYCQNIRFTLWGGYAEYVKVPVDACLPLPVGINFVEGSLLTDTVGTPLSAVERGQVEDATVAVFGCGPLGISAIQLSKMFGAKFVLGIDPLKFRREQARELGADATIDPIADDVVARIKDIVSDVGVDAAINTSDKAEVAQQAMDSLAPGGRLSALVGTPTSIPSDRQFYRAYYFRRHEYQKIARIAVSGKIKLERLVTHTFNLDQISEAFRMRFETPEQSLKVAVLP